MGKKNVRYHKPVTYEAKVRKNKSYFKNYETKLRRRRECKTDYAQRRGLTKQDRNKYNTPKYRFCVRFTNKDIICQIASAKIIGDQVHCAAYARELTRYGLTVGLKNYSAAYATGLLCARRLLSQRSAKDQNLGECYQGVQVDEIDGDQFLEEADDGDPEPFTCNLDLGLAPSSTGSRVFAALKGAVDGGLYIPHNQVRFVGSRKNPDDDADDPYLFDAETMKKYIFGGHVADYMRFMQDANDKKYQAHFSKYIEAGVGADDLEDLYKKVFQAIRDDPSPKFCATAKGGKSQKQAMEQSKGQGSYSKSADCKRISRAEKGKPDPKKPKAYAARQKYLAKRRQQKQERVRKKIAEWKAQQEAEEDD